MTSLLVLVALAVLTPPVPLATGPGTPVWGAQLAPRLEPMVLWQRGPQLVLQSRTATRSVSAQAGALPVRGCATQTRWRLVVPARIDGQWLAVEFLDDHTRALPLASAPVSAAAFEDATCVAALALADGSVVRWGFDGDAAARPLGSAIVDPQELPPGGLLLTSAGGAVFRGGLDARVYRSSGPPVTLDGRALPAAVWATGAQALLVLTERGGVYLVPLQGPPTQLASTREGTHAGLVSWNDAVVWADDAGHVWRLAPGGVPETIAELGDGARGPLLVLDLVDEGRTQLLITNRHSQLAIVHASLDVDWLELPGRSIGPVVVDGLGDEPTLWSCLTAGTHVGLRLGATSGPLFQGGTVEGGTLTLEGLRTPATPWPTLAVTSPGPSAGWSCSTVPTLGPLAVMWFWRRRSRSDGARKPAASDP